ncbi:MAG: PaaI family thioesterase [bacterium]
MITKQRQVKMAHLRDAHHAGCIVCGARNKLGLKLAFQTCEDGSIEGRFTCRRVFQGYDGLLHGGVISAVMDSAMTNCLFAHGITAVTGELTVRFLLAVGLNEEAVVKAHIEEALAPLYLLKATLIQSDRIVARATAKFMERKTDKLERG